MNEVESRKYQWAAAAYDISQCEGLNQYTPMSIFEYRTLKEPSLGVKDFGDLRWGDGFNNLHYDIPYWLLKEYERTKDERAKTLAREMLFYKAHHGLVQGDEYWNEEFNLKGLSFYEKGFNHGDSGEPKMSHHWVAGFWLYWSLTKEQWAFDAAYMGTDALCQEWYIKAYRGAQEVRHLSWPLWNLALAHKYYQAAPARWTVYAHGYFMSILSSEEREGATGWFYGNDIYGNPSEWMQPFMWFGYAAFGLIEYSKQFSNPDARLLLIRMADACKQSLIGGINHASGNRQRITQAYFWYRDGGARGDDGTGELAMLSIPLLKYTGQTEVAEQLEADTVFYRDSGRNVVAINERCVINPFNSPQFAGSMPKTWGQTMFSLFTV